MYAPAGVTVLAFPTDDWVFAERVRTALTQVDVRADLPRELERRLAAVHPRVAVRVRTDLGGIGRDGPVVYVLRDGRVSRDASSEWWAGDPTTALLVTGDDGVYIEATDSAAELFGVPREQIIGKRAGSFTRPDVRVGDAAALWNRLDEAGRLHSSAIISRGDGTELRVEFITLKDVAGTGRHLTMIRSLGPVSSEAPTRRHDSPT